MLGNELDALGTAKVLTSFNLSKALLSQIIDVIRPSFWRDDVISFVPDCVAFGLRMGCIEVSDRAVPRLVLLKNRERSNRD